MVIIGMVSKNMGFIYLLTLLLHYITVYQFYVTHKLTLTVNMVNFVTFIEIPQRKLTHY